MEIKLDPSVTELPILFIIRFDPSNMIRIYQLPADPIASAIGRKCSSCNTVHLRTSFSPRLDRLDCMNSHCKDCQKERTSKHRTA